MKHKLLFISLLAFMPLFFYSCKQSSSVDLDNLEIAQNSYQVGENLVRYIHIISGNSDYTVTVENEDLVEVTYYPDSFDYGAFTIKGLQKGKTMMTVKDNVNGQEKDLAITVTDGYFILQTRDILVEIVSDNPALDDEIKESVRSEHPFRSGSYLAFINREKENFYIFEDYESVETGDYSKSGEHSISADEQLLQNITLSLNNQLVTFDMEFEEGAEQIINELFDIHAVQKSVRIPETNRTSPIFEFSGRMTQDMTDRYQADHPGLKRVEVKIPVTLRHQSVILSEKIAY